MNAKKAIELLNNQITKADTVTIHNYPAWKVQTASHLLDIFGTKSPEYHYVNDYVFIKGLYSESEYRTIIKSGMALMVEFIKSCIDSLKTKKVRPKNSSWFAQFSDTAIWTVISISIPGLLTIGFLVGNYFSDVQNYELRTENKELKGKISAVGVAPLPKANPITYTDTNKHTNEKIDSHRQKKF